MRNLAGQDDSDLCILDELTIAGIAPVEVKPYGEPNAKFAGQFGYWTFHRAWYYWTASSSVGLSLPYAEALHTAIGTEVRVAGHCGCPPPSEWVKHIGNDGRQISIDPEGKEQAGFASYVDRGLLIQSQMDQYRFVKSLDGVEHTSVIDSYHVDSQQGLNMLTQFITLDMKSQVREAIMAARKKS